VGSFRAARRIAIGYASESNAGMKLQKVFEQQLDRDLSLAMKWLQKQSHKPARDFLSSIRKRMSSAAGISRELTSVSEAHAEAHKLNSNIGDMLGAGNVKELAESYQVMDHALTHYIYLAAIKQYIEKGGRSRGSFLVKNAGGENELCEYDRDVEKMILEMSLEGGVPVSKLIKVRDIPDQDLWYEKVWKEYLKDNNKGC
jgi:hypothetical protein